MATNKYTPHLKTKLHDTEVWQDITNYFKDRFEKEPEVELFTFDQSKIAQVCKTVFKNKYPVKDVLDLLSNGFDKRGYKVFDFKRTDFIYQGPKPYQP